MSKLFIVWYLLVNAYSFSSTSSKRRRDLPSIFEKTNVYTIQLPIHPSSSLIWGNLVPPPHRKIIQSNSKTWLNTLLQKKESHHVLGIGIDLSATFTDPTEGSQQLIDKLHHIGFSLSLRERDYLEKVFTQFEQILTCVLERTNPRFTARIVSSRGPIGKKCPRWHVDHVPLRLVLSLVGPGSLYIPLHHEQTWMSKYGSMLVNREALNNLDEDDSEKANHVILPFGGENAVIEGKCGEAILMMGKAWEDDSEYEDLLSTGAIKALVHKSPDLKVDEARVLLTVDIL